MHFKHSFTATLSRKDIPPHRRYVTTLPCETSADTYRHGNLAQLLADTILHNTPQVDAVTGSLWDALTTTTQPTLTRRRCHGNRLWITNDDSWWWWWRWCDCRLQVRWRDMGLTRLLNIDTHQHHDVISKYRNRPPPVSCKGLVLIPVAVKPPITKQTLH